jgi:hypothetical protein
MNRGITRTATITHSSARDSGRVTKTDQSPCEIESALRSCFSAIGPRIMPTMTGATGKP